MGVQTVLTAVSYEAASVNGDRGVTDSSDNDDRRQRAAYSKLSNGSS